jgi:hypothetical protein
MRGSMCMAEPYQTRRPAGNRCTVFTPPTAAIDPITRRSLALSADSPPRSPLVSVRPPAVP